MVGLLDPLRDVPCEDIFGLGASAVATEFCEWVKVGNYVYVPQFNQYQYQLKPHLSTWFSAACAAAIAHRNHFFGLYQQKNSSFTITKIIQASNLIVAKGLLKLPNLRTLVKPKNLSLITAVSRVFDHHLLKKSLIENIIFLCCELTLIDFASCADYIPEVILKNCESELSWVLVEVFNMCLKESCFLHC